MKTAHWIGTFLAMSLLLIGTAWSPAPANLAPLKVDKMEHDFGSIEQGIPQSVTFKLTNNSESALLLTKVKGSCGCTATSYDREPIAPGETGKVTATYNAKKLGSFTKTVTVYTNLETEPLVLTITGKVEAS